MQTSQSMQTSESMQTSKGMQTASVNNVHSTLEIITIFFVSRLSLSLVHIATEDS